MTKSVLTFFTFLLFIAFPAKADYDPLDIYEMIIKADKIAIGEVIKIDSTTFTFKISGSPTNDEGEIIIQRFNDWPCASRWNDYKVGQKLLIFVFNWKGKYIAMSGGNEGELPIQNDSVFINGYSVPPPPPETKSKKTRPLYIDSNHYLIDSKKYFGYRMSLTEMKKTIRIIRSCFDYTKGEYNQPTKWTISCDEKEIQEEAETNKIIEWTYKIAKEKN
jgi:hypothetical protein